MELEFSGVRGFSAAGGHRRRDEALRARDRPDAAHHAGEQSTVERMAEAFVRTLKRKYVRFRPMPEA